MRKLIALGAVLALAACGGGGGGSTTVPGASASATPGPSSSPTTQSKYGTATFHIIVPAKGTSAKTRGPADVSAGTQSVVIKLTADSAGITPSSLTGNPSYANISGLSCGPPDGCTVTGPPSPPGTSDSFTITTYNAMQTGTLTYGGTPVGSALDTASTTVAITEGTANAVPTLTLVGIPATLVLGTLPSGAANSTASQAISLTVEDASGTAITGTYSPSVTVSDPDTNGDGSSIVSGSCPGSYTAGNPAQSASSVIFTSNATTANFCYGGLAENTVTVSASATGLTTVTQVFNPTLSSPVESGSTTGAFVGTDDQLSATTGVGSTGTINWSESGYTNAPYDQVLSVKASGETCSVGGPLSTFATVSPAAGTGGNAGSTVFTVTSASPYTPGKCTIPVYDGVTTNTNLGSYTPGSFTASYTTSGFTVDAHGRTTH